MKLHEIQPPRTFTVGRSGNAMVISDCGRVDLRPDEMVVFTTPGGGEYDVVRKDWGFYATPSLNGRLRDHGLRGVLIRNPHGKAYLLLVERGREAEFEDYMRRDQLHVVAWLDSDEAIESACRKLGASSCPLCGGPDLKTVFSYDRPPPGETAFADRGTNAYPRRYDECQGCGLFIGCLPAGFDGFYSAEYMDATYGERLRATYEKIMQLPPEKSDNVHRVQNILDFMGRWRKEHGCAEMPPPSVLDVGSGLGVFLARMQLAGWKCLALDPDARAAEHARQVVGVDAVCGDFLNVNPPGAYDLVTFNKVLEHVANPVAMLARARSFLAPGGVVYLEVPDAEMAHRLGPGREEFFVEHLWVFSAATLGLLARRANLVIQRMERVVEPSTKFTLRAFLSAA